LTLTSISETDKRNEKKLRYDHDIDILKEKFYENMGTGIINCLFSLGRVNLIGEHTDYNAGYVFPCALNYGTYLAIRTTGENCLKFSTLNFNEDQETELRELLTARDKSWINYPLGVINEFLKKNIKISGLELLFYGDVPNGAGLSSSASIEMVTAVPLMNCSWQGFQTLDLVRMVSKSRK
jgi:galactokinase